MDNILEDKKIQLFEVEFCINNCINCDLCKTRTNPVPGLGPFDADLMIIGEAPGQQEDQQGIPFVGRAGNKFDEALKEAGIDRNKIFITNVIKCRPPNNRNPEPFEIDTCNRYLRQQIKIIEPKIIILLGNIALSLITETASGITKQRGTILEYCSVPTIPTFHPSYILRNPSKMNFLIDDLKMTKKFIK